MLYVCIIKFDVTINLNFFYNFFKTEQGLDLTRQPSSHPPILSFGTSTVYGRKTAAAQH